MKIVYCIPYIYNSAGMERVLISKVNYLVREKNYAITIITTDQGNRKPYFELDPRVRLVDFALNFDQHFNANLVSKYILHRRKQKQYRRRLEDFLLNHRPDYCVSLMGKEIEFLTRLNDPSIKIAENHFSKQFRKQFLMARKKGPLWRWLGNFRIWQQGRETKNLRYLVVLTKADEREWKKTHNNIVQIYNPAPFSSPEVAPLQAKRVIAMGRLDPQKGFDRLIPIWKHVAAEKPGWILQIWGKGEMENQLKTLISQNGLHNHVFLMGSTADSQREYLNSSLLVMTSRYEGFPMVLVEAATCGLPLVAFNCRHGPADIIRDGWNGYLIPEGDEQKMAECLCRLMNAPALRLEMGRNARETSRMFHLETIMQQWTTLFENTPASTPKTEHR